MRRNPRELEKTHAHLTRRAMLLGGVQLAFVGALGLRMRQLQLEEAEVLRNFSHHEDVTIRGVRPVIETERSGNKLRKLMTVLVVIALVGLGLLWWQNRGEEFYLSIFLVFVFVFVFMKPIHVDNFPGEAIERFGFPV